MATTRRPKPVDHPDKTWTVLIYQAGDNNLNEECIYALKDMKRVGTSELDPVDGKLKSALNVIVKFDPAGRANPTRTFEIEGSGGDDTLADDVTETKGEIDTGNWRNLLNFLTKYIKKYRTDRYMVILSGHGAGMREGFFLKDEERPLSSIPSFFPINMLRKVFGSADLKRALGRRKIDLLGFDACLMSMVEVCYELRALGTLDLVVSSEGFTLNSGWPMDRVMRKIKSDPDIAPDALAKAVVDDYVAYYRDYTLGGVSIDLSVMKLGRVDNLISKLDVLASRMKYAFENEAPPGRLIPKAKGRSELGDDDDGYDEDESTEGAHLELARTIKGRRLYYYGEEGRPFQDAILLAHWAAQSYNGEQSVDLFDFCNLLQKRLPKSQQKDPKSVWYACEQVKNALTRPAQRLVTYSCYAGSTFQYSFGASLYFPWAFFDSAPSYKRLRFAQYTLWPKFLEIYLKATRRRERRGPGFEHIGKRFRYTPPTDKGPEGKVFSMRNPPTNWKIPPCDEE